MNCNFIVEIATSSVLLLQKHQLTRFAKILVEDTMTPLERTHMESQEQCSLSKHQAPQNTCLAIAVRTHRIKNKAFHSTEWFLHPSAWGFIHT